MSFIFPIFSLTDALNVLDPELKYPLFTTVYLDQGKRDINLPFFTNDSPELILHIKRSRPLNQRRF